MKRTGRLAAVCAELSSCARFADVGCDHGYCTQFMLENGLCRSAVISDVSAKSLAKAEKLLQAYIEEGRVQSVCCAGLSAVPPCDEVLIAGMGGEEIVSILREGFLPPQLVLQPMKNAPKVRAFLLESGYRILHDYTYFEGRKRYHILRAAKAPAEEELSAGDVQGYGAAELAFGRDNLLTPSAAFLRYLEGEIAALGARMAAANGPLPAAKRRLQLAEAALAAARGGRHEHP